MAQLVQVATLWSLRDYPTRATPWALPRQIRAVAEAGFEGLTTVLTPEHRRLAEAAGLRHLIGFISTGEPNDFERLLRAQKEAGAVQINVQLDDHDTPPAVATRHWLRLVRTAERIGGVVPSLEIHRDCCTETPEKTYEIADRYHRATGEMIRCNFDFSHFAVVKHLNPANYSARLLDHPALVQHSAQCHLRPFNGHHAQVPVTHRGRLTPEVKSYLGFVRDLFRLWRAASANARRTLFACPEMGAYAPDDSGSGYNITGLRPAWPEAVILRGELAKAWRQSA
jgi:hypothetical protein